MFFFKKSQNTDQMNLFFKFSLELKTLSSFTLEQISMDEL